MGPKGSGHPSVGRGMRGKTSSSKGKGKPQNNPRNKRNFLKKNQLLLTNF
jgi:hypothetical protein